MKALLLGFLITSFNTIASDQLFIGKYIVPVQDTNLKDFASSAINNIKYDANAISFKLPPVIASDEALEIIFFRSDNDPNEFLSPFGQVNCLKENQIKVKCKVRYNNIYSSFLKSKLKETEVLIKEQSSSYEEIDAKTRIAYSFSTNPIGILIIHLY